MVQRRTADMVNITEPTEVLDEVGHIVQRMFPRFKLGPVVQVFKDILRLFEGEYPGYRKCNTEYHDLRHTTDTFLTMARLMHGAWVEKCGISEGGVRLGLISALLHDTGYIQTVDDTQGTGAKYTLVHVERSIEFMEKYLAGNAYTPEDFEVCRTILLCTGLQSMMHSIPFKSAEIELHGRMLGTADLVGQMADWAYLEKLLFLYYEFKEAGIRAYQQEGDILLKTIDFFQATIERLQSEFGGVDRYLAAHFKARWGINKDIYRESMDKNLRYVQKLMQEHQQDYRNYLRRAGVVHKIRGQHEA